VVAARTPHRAHMSNGVLSDLAANKANDRVCLEIDSSSDFLLFFTGDTTIVVVISRLACRNQPKGALLLYRPLVNIFSECGAVSSSSCEELMSLRSWRMVGMAYMDQSTSEQTLINSTMPSPT
jgi:hypothetical protein